MAQALNQTWRQARVNILKKVRIDGVWKLCPAVIEAGGKLKHRVRVGDRVESHPEGTYYIDWRENGRRIREAIPESNDVRERARLKALEIEARRAGIAIPDPEARPELKPTEQARTQSPGMQPAPPGSVVDALGSFLRPALEQAVTSELQRLGLNSGSAGPRTLPEWNQNGHGSVAVSGAMEAAALG
ncbi:MAG TPA: hypothetical protein VJT08_07195, partial [Terriglobales bacterium]|nr:hypothetical protein [Terriglobales bacterium]